jgi:hypothetical protein
MTLKLNLVEECRIKYVGSENNKSRVRELMLKALSVPIIRADLFHEYEESSKLFWVPSKVAEMEDAWFSYGNRSFIMLLRCKLIGFELAIYDTQSPRQFFDNHVFLPSYADILACHESAIHMVGQVGDRDLYKIT